MRNAVVAHVAVMWFFMGAGLPAQVTWRPAPSPARTAAQAEWYLARDPILVAGDWYYPAGPSRYFHGETMVQVGTYGGVPLYADTTLEPHSMVLVPIGRGLVQPYERPRSGQLAGTVGSRTPSFPVQRDFEVPVPVQYWDYLWYPDYDVPAPYDRPSALIGTHADDGGEAPPTPTGGVLRSAQPPEGPWGVWVAFGQARWASAGRAVPFDSAHFERVGEYRGFGVFRSRLDPSDAVLYLPSRTGVVAPYRKVGTLDP